MRYLENDLDNLKQLYENEYKHLRMQIDTLNKEKNKLIVDNQSYDRNCRDLSTKCVYKLMVLILFRLRYAYIYVLSF